MKKNVLALSIAAMIGGLGFAGAASAGLVEGQGTSPTAAEFAVNKDGLEITLGATGPTAGKMSKTTATELNLAEGGVGHMLLVPYYTAQNVT